MIVRPFRESDLEALRVQRRQAWSLGHVTDDVLTLMAAGPAYTLEDGRPLAIAGIAPVGDKRVAWAWLAECVPLLTLTRFVQAALAVSGEVYAYAALDWPQAQRWLKVLGFCSTGNIAKFGGVAHGEWCRG